MFVRLGLLFFFFRTRVKDLKSSVANLRAQTSNSSLRNSFDKISTDRRKAGESSAWKTADLPGYGRDDLFQGNMIYKRKERGFDTVEQLGSNGYPKSTKQWQQVSEIVIFHPANRAGSFVWSFFSLAFNAVGDLGPSASQPAITQKNILRLIVFHQALGKRSSSAKLNIWICPLFRLISIQCLVVQIRKCYSEFNLPSWGKHNWLL